jgi:hypothetical protein
MLPDVAVPNYGDAYNSLGNVYDPQTSQVNTEIAQLAPQQAAQQSALDQAKVNAFQDINSQANSKGLLFSGFTPGQQAVYTGTKYLPAVANLQTSFNNTKNTLLDKINQINAQRATQAQGIVSSATTAAQNAQYKNAQLTLSQQKADQQLALAQTKAAASASKAAATPMTTQQLSAAIRSGLNGVKGGDGYVSPQDYATAYKDWTTAGNSGATFDNYFGDLMNPKNGYYQYAKTKG